MSVSPAIPVYRAPEEEAPSEEMDEAPVEEAAPEPVEEKAQGPREILVREGTLFLLDFDKSDVGIKVNGDCEKKSGGDPAKKANCVSKAMDKIPREGISFDEDDEGNWWYIRFGIEKGVQVIYNKVQVEVGEASGRNITLTPTLLRVLGARSSSHWGDGAKACLPDSEQTTRRPSSPPSCRSCGSSWTAASRDCTTEPRTSG